MKIVVAPNAFKDCMTAHRAAEAMAEGIARIPASIDIACCPVADGGDGVGLVLQDALKLEQKRTTVRDPLGRKIEAPLWWNVERKLAVIEMARASGLALLSIEERDPTRTTTLGTGDLIHAALDLGAEQLVIGIGGSATCDGGAGMAEALGVRLLDGDGAEVLPTGGALGHVATLDLTQLDPQLRAIQCQVMCDVDNPLLGPTGAAQVYGPQKGATPEQVEQLEQGLFVWAEHLESFAGSPVRDVPGSGAAGGLGAALLALLQAKLRPGIEIVLDLLDFDFLVCEADLVITAEGQLDGQSAFGKAPAGVAKRAQQAGTVCIAIAGSLGDGVENLHECGIQSLTSLCTGPMSLQEAMERGPELLADTTEELVRCFLAGSGRLAR